MNKADAMAWQRRRLGIGNSTPLLPAGIFRNTKERMGGTPLQPIGICVCTRTAGCKDVKDTRQSAFHLLQGLFSECGGYAHEMCTIEMHGIATGS